MRKATKRPTKKDRVPLALGALRLARKDQIRIEATQRAVDQSARRIRRAMDRLETLRVVTARALVEHDKDYGVFARATFEDLTRQRDEAIRVAEELAGQLQELRDAARRAPAGV